MKVWRLRKLETKYKENKYKEEETIEEFHDNGKIKKYIQGKCKGTPRQKNASNKGLLNPRRWWYWEKI